MWEAEFPMHNLRKYARNIKPHTPCGPHEALSPNSTLCLQHLQGASSFSERASQVVFPWKECLGSILLRIVSVSYCIAKARNSSRPIDVYTGDQYSTALQKLFEAPVVRKPQCFLCTLARSCAQSAHRARFWGFPKIFGGRRDLIPYTLHAVCCWRITVAGTTTGCSGALADTPALGSTKASDCPFGLHVATLTSQSLSAGLGQSIGPNSPAHPQTQNLSA